MVGQYAGEDQDMWPYNQEWNGHGRAPSRSRVRPASSSRRVDMAAMINQGGDTESIEFPKEKYMEQYSETLDESRDSGDDDESSQGMACCLVSRPCLCTCALVLFAIAAVFAAGLGTGLAMKEKDSPSFNGVNSGVNNGDDSASGGDGSPTSSPVSPQPTMPLPTAGPSPLIVFDVDVDFGSGNTPGTDSQDGGDQGQNDNSGENSNPQDQGQNNNPQNGDQQTPGNGDFVPRFVGVYYYPWHGNNFHNREGYMRKELLPDKHTPTLGEYDDSRPEVISQHLSWSRQANVGLWVTSWWGPGTTEDVNTRKILDHSEIGELKIALHYETINRLGSFAERLSNADTDIAHICENYFKHPSYYRVDGRPVIFMYLTRLMEQNGVLPQATLALQQAASLCNEDIFIVGDHVFFDAPDPNLIFEASYYLDAITNYDMYGSMSKPTYAGRQVVDAYYREAEEWKDIAKAHDCRFIPSVTPGYNDRGVRLQADNPPMSRRLTPNAEEGSLFAYQIEQARELVDLDNLIMVNSFNEWHEDTQIEPVVGNAATEPVLYTGGVEYVGYGELYLDILRRGTLDGESNMFDYDA